MAGPYYVNNAATGSGTGANWTNAFTTLAAAIGVAVAGDKVYVVNTHTETFASNQTFAPAAGVELITTSDTAHAPPTTYATMASSTGVLITTGTAYIAINGNSTWRGFKFSIGTASNAASLFLCFADNTSVTLEDCAVSFGMSGSGNGTVRIGFGTAGTNTIVYTRNCTFTWAEAADGFDIRTQWFDEGSNMDAGSAHPTTLVKAASTTNAEVQWNGSDLSGNANTLFCNGGANYTARLTNCKLHASATIQATPTVDGAGEVFLFDCAALKDSDNTGADLHYNFAHYSYRGNTVATASKYVTADGASYDGTGRHSLTVTGTNATFGAPYFSPWIDAYTTGGSAVTPYFETARDGSATKYNNNEAWAEFMAKTSSGYTISTFYSDRTAVLGTPAAQATGAGTGAWTGLSGTAASMKLDSGAAITPAEIGFVRGRIAVAGAFAVQLDPKIRGL